jgi:hypothetical protein
MSEENDYDKECYLCRTITEDVIKLRHGRTQICRNCYNTIKQRYAEQGFNEFDAELL